MPKGQTLLNEAKHSFPPKKVKKNENTSDYIIIFFNLERNT